jgi:hypothetical protein
MRNLLSTDAVAPINTVYNWPSSGRRSKISSYNYGYGEQEYKEKYHYSHPKLYGPFHHAFQARSIKVHSAAYSPHIYYHP